MFFHSRLSPLKHLQELMQCSLTVSVSQGLGSLLSHLADLDLPEVVAGLMS